MICSPLHLSEIREKNNDAARFVAIGKSARKAILVLAGFVAIGKSARKSDNSARRVCGESFSSTRVDVSIYHFQLIRANGALTTVDCRLGKNIHACICTYIRTDGTK